MKSSINQINHIQSEALYSPAVTFLAHMSDYNIWAITKATKNRQDSSILISQQRQV